MAAILVVEDNPQNLKLTTIILESAGHLVVPAHDADEAERAIEAAVPDLVVMDISLPGRDGYALTRTLRAAAATAHLPILVVTALAMPGDARKAFEAGASGYVTKPIRRATLLDQVATLLPPSGAPDLGATRTEPWVPEEEKN